MKKLEIDYEILKSLIPEKDLPNFLVFENIQIYNSFIIAPYRAPFSKDFTVSIEKYKLKKREEKLKKILK